MTYLLLDGIRASYGGTTVLDNIDLAVGKSEMHVLLGPSGCGKTTLLRSIAGLVRPDGGRIVLEGRSIGALPPKDRGIGMVFQHYALFPNMTVRQNLAFGLEQRRMEKRIIGHKVDAALDTVSLTDRADMRPHQLSGGQKQRVALARALVLEPKLMLLDEPLSALDAQIRKRLREELKRIQRETGLTSILVTHDQDEALSLGDRISVMNAGRIVQTGNGQDIYYRPADDFVARFIGDANIIEASRIEILARKAPGKTAIIQPHAIKIGTTSEDALNLRARVLEASVAGASVRYLMDVAGVPLKVRTHTSSEGQYLSAGSESSLSVRWKDIHFIPSVAVAEGNVNGYMPTAHSPEGVLRPNLQK
ncbi:ABC transporter ATP-binding protein [Phyllobacterium phragmitis]|uniref:ABC transporter ATP-binding protein n=1 Tax=Phyllobacterium phragmitis TaxID=2670329 RepID=A0A2S9IPW9_9HYPH|nr:ABC transporter ATP-binding protein [Phyllobacterium phragmitis]PRD42578.1 ABC transporter ATP-binding protein [Phyllobacterium phragmitis]